MKKYFIFVVVILLGFLSSCSSYDKKAYYQVMQLEKTNYKKVLGSEFKSLEINDEFTQTLINFSYKTASGLLESRNGMYSPISFYIALSELAELTGGETRTEILTALNVDDIEILRDGNQNLYKKLSYTNIISTLSIANSIWLNQYDNYKEEALEILRDKYYASSYGIDFSNLDDKELIGKWVNDNTGGKLGKGDFDNLDANTIFVLINTIYFHDEWESKFIKSQNVMGAFEGLEEKVEYMVQKLDGYYYKDNEYESSFIDFKNGLKIVFVAPNDSNSFSEFVSDPLKLESTLGFEFSDKRFVEYIIPKYSYKSNFNLINYSKTMGINKAFNTADFSPLTETSLFVNAMYQKSFIEIDEEGGRAAAYTAAEGVKSAAPSDPVTFNLNRPFVYAIYSGEYPLFIGAVTNPGSNQEEVYK